MKKNLVLFYCGLRTGHFGQGAFVNSFLSYFKTRPDISLTIIKTDCINIPSVTYSKEDNVDIISVPRSQNLPMLTGEDNEMQKTYARQVINNLSRFLQNKSDLLFCVNSIDYLNVCAELKIRYKDCKLIYIHHSFSWKYYLNISDDLFENAWKNQDALLHPQAFEMTYYQCKIALISDRVITVTKHAKDFFVKVLNVERNKINVIYNGVELPRLEKKSKQLLREKYGFSKKEKIILFSGRITYDKGFPFLLKAFKILLNRCMNIRLVVMGSGRPFEFTDLISPFWNKVTFTGELSSDLVSDFYKLSDIGVMPSLHEQCSFTAIEMRLHKLPLIVSGVDGLDEMFVDEYDCLKASIRVDKLNNKYLDESEIANQIERLLSDKSFSKKISKASYEKGRHHFTRDEMWRNYGSMINTIWN